MAYHFFNKGIYHFHFQQYLKSVKTQNTFRKFLQKVIRKILVMNVSIIESTLLMNHHHNHLISQKKKKNIFEIIPYNKTINFDDKMPSAFVYVYSIKALGAVT